MTDSPVLGLENEFGKFGFGREGCPTVLNNGVHGSVEEGVEETGNV
jgi:hypothetical protein